MNTDDIKRYLSFENLLTCTHSKCNKKVGRHYLIDDSFSLFVPTFVLLNYQVVCYQINIYEIKIFYFEKLV